MEALVGTKRPQIFAESDVSGDGSDWTRAELSILGDISVAMPVTVFDNGLYHQLGPYLQQSIKAFLGTQGTAFSNLEAVYYDPYNECENERHLLHGIHLLVRPLMKGNLHKSQLCPPERYQEEGDDFSIYPS